MENELLELSSFELLELFLDKIGNDFNDFMDFYEGDDPKFEVKIETHKRNVRKKLYRDIYGEEYYDDEYFTSYGGNVFSVHSYDVDGFVDYILSSDDYEDYKSIIEDIEPFVFYRISYHTINHDGELNGGIGSESLLCWDAKEVEISLLHDISYLGDRLTDDLDSIEVDVWMQDADDDLMGIYERVKAEALKYEKGE